MTLPCLLIKTIHYEKGKTSSHLTLDYEQSRMTKPLLLLMMMMMMIIMITTMMVMISTVLQEQ
jgi:hypothetical protein